MEYQWRFRLPLTAVLALYVICSVSGQDEPMCGSSSPFNSRIFTLGAAFNVTASGADDTTTTAGGGDRCGCALRRLNNHSVVAVITLRRFDCSATGSTSLQVYKDSCLDTQVNCSDTLNPFFIHLDGPREQELFIGFASTSNVPDTVQAEIEIHIAVNPDPSGGESIEIQCGLDTATSVQAPGPGCRTTEPPVTTPTAGNNAQASVQADSTPADVTVGQQGVSTESGQGSQGGQQTTHPTSMAQSTAAALTGRATATSDAMTYGTGDDGSVPVSTEPGAGLTGPGGAATSTTGPQSSPASGPASPAPTPSRGPGDLRPETLLGPVIGGCVGGVVLIIVLVILCATCCHNRKKKAKSKKGSSLGTDNAPMTELPPDIGYAYAKSLPSNGSSVISEGPRVRNGEILPDVTWGVDSRVSRAPGVSMEPDPPYHTLERLPQEAYPGSMLELSASRARQQTRVERSASHREQPISASMGDFHFHLETGPPMQQRGRPASEIGVSRRAQPPPRAAVSEIGVSSSQPRPVAPPQVPQHYAQQSHYAPASDASGTSQGSRGPSVGSITDIQVPPPRLQRFNSLGSDRGPVSRRHPEYNQQQQHQHQQQPVRSSTNPRPQEGPRPPPHHSQYHSQSLVQNRPMPPPHHQQQQQIHHNHPQHNVRRSNTFQGPSSNVHYQTLEERRVEQYGAGPQRGHRTLEVQHSAPVEVHGGHHGRPHSHAESRNPEPPQVPAHRDYYQEEPRVPAPPPVPHPPAGQPPERSHAHSDINSNFVLRPKPHEHGRGGGGNRTPAAPPPPPPPAPPPPPVFSAPSTPVTPAPPTQQEIIYAKPNLAAKRNSKRNSQLTGITESEWEQVVDEQFEFIDRDVYAQAY